MGSPVSPIIANLYMEWFEEEAIKSAPDDCKPTLFLRYVDDTLEITKRGKHQQLTSHLNTVDPTGSIKFTCETAENNKIACLDTLLEIKQDGSIKSTVYRKHTHTNRYLNFGSHHPLQQRLGVGRSLLDRKDSIISDPEDKIVEEQAIVTALKNNGYQKWAINKLMKQHQDGKQNKDKNKNKQKVDKQYKDRKLVVLPYMKGTTERLKKLFKKYDVDTAIKPAKTIRRQIVHMKDKIPTMNTCDCVYSIPCKNCNDKYIGTTGRPLKVRISEHQKDVKENQKKTYTRAMRKTSLTELNKSAVTDHVNKYNHEIDWENTKVVAKETNEYIRLYREAIAIRREPEVMNRDEGAKDLPHIYDSLLLYLDKNRTTQKTRSGALSGRGTARR